MKYFLKVLAGVLFFMQTAAEENFDNFLDGFVNDLSVKSKQFNKVVWIAETTGARDAFDLMTELNVEVQLMYSDRGIYDKLLKWQETEAVKDPLKQRQIDVLIRNFKNYMLPKELLEKISAKESEIVRLYNSFRPKMDGRSYSESEIVDLLKNETSPVKKRRIWEMSKEVGDVLAPHVKEVVKLRNEAARLLGYQDYFQMQLSLQEVDRDWLLDIFEKLSKSSAEAYDKTLEEIETYQMQKYEVGKKELGPWAWCDPFCQEDPVETAEIDKVFKDKDIVSAARNCYRDMGFDVGPVLERSDLYERKDKNQHAFCINMDRGKDVRTLQNVKPTIRCMDTMLHELGHAVYDLGYNPQLPWLLRDHPHLLTTEAMALLAGRMAYDPIFVARYIDDSKDVALLMEKALKSKKRRQLIFSRWVLVMTNFESEMYRDPDQDLNSLWWSLVEKYQKIKMPPGRKGHSDWSAKYHIAMAPVYYYSYLLGELFASQMEEKIIKDYGAIWNKKAGAFLEEKLYKPGESMSWDKLVKYVVGRPLDADSWLRQFAR